MKASNPAEARGTEKVSTKCGATPELYRRYRGLVQFVVAEKLSGLPRQEIEDVVSELWVKLLKNDGARIKGFGNKSQFSTWLAKVALNAARDYLRKKRIYSVPIDGWGGDDEGTYTLHDLLSDPSPQPLSRLLARERQREVAKAVKGLPKNYRDVVLARFYKGWSVTETARRLRVTENTVYIRLSRATVKLRKSLAELTSAPDGREERDSASGEKRMKGRHVSHIEMVKLLDRASGGNDPPEQGSSGDHGGNWTDIHLAGCKECFGELFELAIVWRLLEGIFSENPGARRSHRRRAAGSPSNPPRY